jgi:hypothetical protein
MAHDIDEVWELCKDIKDKCNKLLDKNKIKRICTTCGGTGVDVYFNEDPEVSLERPYPLCNGNKEIPWGQIIKEG